MVDSKFAAELARLAENVRAVKPSYERDLDKTLVEAAEVGEAYMKATASWRDDTGNRKDRVPGAARAGLFAVANVDGDHKEIVFSHGVDYGIWLEIKQSGRHEVIMPSIKHIGELLMRSTAESLTVGFRRLPGNTGAVRKAQKAIGRAEKASGRSDRAAERARTLTANARTDAQHEAAMKASTRASAAAERARKAHGVAERAAAKTRNPKRRSRKRR